MSSLRNEGSEPLFGIIDGDVNDEGDQIKLLSLDTEVEANWHPTKPRCTLYRIKKVEGLAWCLRLPDDEDAEKICVEAFAAQGLTSRLDGYFSSSGLNELKNLAKVEDCLNVDKKGVLKQGIELLASKPPVGAFAEIASAMKFVARKAGDTFDLLP